MKVRFDSCSDAQANFGKSEDPRPHLKQGQEYEVDRVETHNWYTLYYLTSFSIPFNSVCFIVTEESKDAKEANGK